MRDIEKFGQVDSVLPADGRRPERQVYKDTNLAKDERISGAQLRMKASANCLQHSLLNHMACGIERDAIGETGRARASAHFEADVGDIHGYISFDGMNSENGKARKP